MQYDYVPDYYVMEDIIKSGRRVLCRIDINSPIDSDGNILSDWRFLAHKKTLQWLLENDNAVIVLAHQGRPNDPDFSSLKKHAEVLSRILNAEVNFVPDVIGSNAKQAIKNLKPREILLLENVRFLPDEVENKPIHEHTKSTIVRELAPLADYFVLDGFAVSHRSHASVVGFAPVLPSSAGFIMDKEVQTFSDFLDDDEYYFVFGGAKVSDVVKSILKLIKRNKKVVVLLTGLTALAFHYVDGLKLPPQTEELVKRRIDGLVDHIKYIKRKTTVYLPLDYAVAEGEDRKEYQIEDVPYLKSPIMDIGMSTVEHYLDVLKDSETVFLKGPAGVIEDKRFRVGSKALLEGLFDMNKFIVFLGGHLSVILKEIDGSISTQYYVSTGGGAAIHYLANGTLPGIEALKISKKKFAAIL